MRLGVFCALLGYFVLVAATNQDKNVHIKIHVPELIHKHNHEHTIYKGAPAARYEISITDPDGSTKEHIILQSNDYNTENDTPSQKYAYNPEKKEKSKHKKVGKKKAKKPKKKLEDDQDFKKILDNYNVKPEEDDDDGRFKTSVRTEHYEVKKINPNARFPDEKYIIEGAYKVQETDPWGQPVTSFEKYDSPISKIAASIITHYDYTNSKPGQSDSFGKDKEEDRNHENIEYGPHDDTYENYHKKSQDYHEKKSPDDTYENYHKKSQNYHEQKSPEHSKYESYELPKKNEKDYERSAGYEVFINEKNGYKTAPSNVVIAHPSHKELLEKQRNQKAQGYTGPMGYGTFKPDDSKRIENVEKRPVEVVYVSPQDHDSVKRGLEYEFEKEFGHLVQPSHNEGSRDSHYGYDNDNEWQKHLIDYLYGEDHAASDKYVQKVKPQDAIRKS